MVLNLVGSVVGLVKVRLLHTEVDNYIFRLHYRWTTTFCYLACALVAASDYIGKAIQCIDGSGGSVSKAYTTYCWIRSTYTLNTSMSQTGDVAHHGTGPTHLNNHETTHHAYYQWVPFVLFFQGCLFYLPHQLWKSFEGKTADTLMQGLQFNSMDEERVQKRENVVKYLKSSWGRNSRYAFVYIGCEILNFVNVISQMFLLNEFFGGAFMTYGSEVLNFAFEDAEAQSTMNDPMTERFPRMTKCDFYKYGPSGTLQKLDALCVLPQNILNQRIFVAMWFWFIILATVTAMEVVWRILVALSPMVRIRMMERRGKLSASPRLEGFIRRLHMGDYFLLDVLGQNLDSLNFKDILLGAADAIDDDSTTYKPFYEPEDDDPLALKRQMEREDSTSV